jgi:hypothetical protein
VEAPPFDREVLHRLPLAEAVLLVLQQATLPEACLDLFDRLRDRCYTRKLPFDLFVRLIGDALVRYHGSGRQAFHAARDAGLLDTSDQAVYGKLAAVPLPLSAAFLRDNAQRLRALLPQGLTTPVPASLRHFRVEVFDGKVTKRVAKRLKVLRGLSGGALGGKGLVSLDLHTGLVTALASAADGDANDASLVGPLAAQVRPLVPAAQQILWVGDSQFANLTQPRQLQGSEQDQPGRSDHFLLRYNGSTTFTPDPATPWQPATTAAAVDSRGRTYRQEWGWLGAASSGKRLYVRRITLERPGEKAVVLLTDLLDPTAYPAAELLDCYLQRGTIEGVFQKITEVFSLDKLIASQPKGTVFQLSFCLLLYNAIVVLGSHLAAGQELTVPQVSLEMVFRDVREELVALLRVVGPTAGGLGRLWDGELTAEQVRQRLAERLCGRWRPIWKKATNKKRRAHPDKPHGRVHCSVQRVVEQHKKQKASPIGVESP